MTRGQTGAPSWRARMPYTDEEIFWDCAYCEGRNGLPRASTNSVRCTASQCKDAQTAERAAARTALPVVAPCAPKAEPTTCFKIKEVLGVSMCTEKMTDEESRCGRARSDEEICYQLRGKFGKSSDEDVDDMVPGTTWVKLIELVENIDEAGCALLDSFARELAKATKQARKRLRES